MITLASDFGSPYPAAMRGVCLSLSRARLVDVAHDLPRQDVRAAAFWLREVLPWFPPAVHLAVVDPGVGTDRAALVVRAGEHVLVGPDNGSLLPPARALAAGATGTPEEDDPANVSEDVADDLAVYAVDPGVPATSTFHGRDVFAPAAARVHEAASYGGTAPVEPPGGPDTAALDGLGDLEGLRHVDPAVDLRFPAADVGDGRAGGEVLVVDGFGNVVTNVPGSALEGRWGEAVAVDGERVSVERSYAMVDHGDRLATVGSHGNVELAVNRGRGDEAFGLGPGDGVVLSWCD